MSKRTSIENGEGYLDKEATSHDDLFDSFRPSCNSGIRDCSFRKSLWSICITREAVVARAV